MITEVSKIVCVTDDNVEHGSIREALYHEFHVMYKSTIDSGQFYDNGMQKPIISSSVSLIKLFRLQPLLLTKIKMILWIEKNPNASLQDLRDIEKCY